MKKLFVIGAIAFSAAFASPVFAHKQYVGDGGANVPGSKYVQMELAACTNSIVSINLKPLHFGNQNTYLSVRDLNKAYDKHIAQLEAMRVKQILRMKEVDTNRDGVIDKTELMSECQSLQKDRHVSTSIKKTVPPKNLNDRTTNRISSEVKKERMRTHLN